MENTEDHIPTAREVLIQHVPNDCIWEDMDNLTNVPIKFVLRAMNDFAKMHVEKALEAAQDNVRLRGAAMHNNKLPDETDVESVLERNDNTDDYYFTVDKQTIANAYPLTNIQ